MSTPLKTPSKTPSKDGTAVTPEVQMKAIDGLIQFGQQAVQLQANFIQGNRQGAENIAENTCSSMCKANLTGTEKFLASNRESAAAMRQIMGWDTPSSSSAASQPPQQVPSFNFGASNPFGTSFGHPTSNVGVSNPFAGVSFANPPANNAGVSNAFGPSFDNPPSNVGASNPFGSASFASPPANNMGVSNAFGTSFCNPPSNVGVSNLFATSFGSPSGNNMGVPNPSSNSGLKPPPHQPQQADSAAGAMDCSPTSSPSATPADTKPWRGNFTSANRRSKSSLADFV